MATCDSLQPVVLLTDVMDPTISKIETIFVPAVENNSNSGWFQVEQTEPLNLCLNGSILNGFAMVKYQPKTEDSESLDEGSDDDVVFVKQYKINKDRSMKRARKTSAKGPPRRNPIRKARVSKRFEEYTNETFDDDEFCDGSVVEDGEFVDVSEKFPTKNEDCEDWKVEDVLSKKSRHRRGQVNKKINYTNRLGRKRKCNNVMKINEKKVLLKELEPLIESNLLLIRDYIADVKELNELSIKKEKNSECVKSERTENAKNILKQQAILLAVAKDVVDGDVLKCLTK